MDRDVYLKSKSRLALIHKAQQFLERREKKLRGARGGIVDTFDACAIALFHEILTGDGDPATEEIRVGGRNQDVPTPLHKAIKTDIRKQQPKKKEDPETRIKEAEKELGVDLDGDGDIGGDQGEKADGPVRVAKFECAQRLVSRFPFRAWRLAGRDGAGGLTECSATQHARRR